jgi:inosine-uridine nucleoside N-ribohydrolase
VKAARALRGLTIAWGLATTFLAPAPADAAPPTRVVVVTDAGAGPDDDWAIAHLAHAPGVELVGVLATHAPALAYPASKTAAGHAKAILAAAGRADVPVLPGLVEPFGGEQDIRPGPAVDFLLAASRGHSRERPLRVLLLGAATEVALALVVEPAAAQRLEVIATGFDAWPRGGDAGNVKADPLAWHLLLQLGAELVVADATVAKRDLTLPRDRARELAAGGGRLGTTLDTGFAGWIARDAARKAADAAVVRDEAAVAWLLGHARAETHPRPRLAPDLTLRAGAGGPAIRWITAIEPEPLWRSFAESLAQAPGARTP